MEAPLFSVVIPVFNEEKNIGFVIRGVHHVLKRMGFPYEVIVVDDGSVDRTAEVAKNCDVKLINNDMNLGKGVALRAGFVKARGQFIVTMDGDGSHRPEDIPSLVYSLLGDKDVHVVMSTRFDDELGKNSTTKLHLIGNVIINILILFLTGKRITDSQSGLRVFKRDVLRKLSLDSSGYDIESEIIVKILKNGYKIKEVPIQCRKRYSGASKINSFKDGFEILKAILKAKFCS